MKKHLKQVNEIVQSPDYNGQAIHLHDDGEDETCDSIDSSSDSDSEPVMVLLDTITSENPVEHSVHNLSSNTLTRSSLQSKSMTSAVFR